MTALQRFFPLALAAALTAVPAAAAAPPLRPSAVIIPLPLNPIVPAAQRLCTLKTASGLGYTILRAGTGTKPSRDAVTLVNYVGYLAATGAVFDQGMRSALPVDGVIPGFGEGLMLATKGSVMRLCIPAAQGYGAAGSGPIPANADLVFQIELTDFKTRAEIEALTKQAETAAPPTAPVTPPPGK